MNRDRESDKVVRLDILNKHLKLEIDAQNIYERVIDMDTDLNNIKSLRGFALIGIGKNEDAITWFNNILANKYNAIAYDKYLRGKDGGFSFEVNARGQHQKTFDYVRTLDHEMKDYLNDVSSFSILMLSIRILPKKKF